MRPVTTWMGLLLILSVGELAVAQELPPEIRADQYLMEGQRALEHKDPAAAVKAFKKVEALPVDPPVDFAFWYGRALVEQGITQEDVGMVTKGEGFLTQYLLETGRESDHYTNALTWLSQAEGHGLPRPRHPAHDPGPPTAQAAAPEEPEQKPEAQGTKETKLDQCDNRLWGEWNCSQTSLILSNRIDSKGIEQVTVDWASGLFSREKTTYPVDEKWHPNSKTKKYDNVSCGGWNKHGFRELNIMTRDAPGKKSGNYISYFVDGSIRLWMLSGEYNRDKDGNFTTKENTRYRCDRDDGLF